VAGDPTNAGTLYLAAADGGVWKTTDGGSHWGPLTDGQVTLVMGAIALAPSNPQVIYAGTGEANLGPSQLALGRTDMGYGDGVLKSTDGGSTWALLGSAVFNRLSISKIVVDPANSSIVYVTVGAAATNGLAGSTGVWKSTDGGNTWADTTVSITTTAPFSDLAINPANDQVLYAAVGDPAGNAVNGLYESTNAGTNWSQLANFPNGAANASVGRITLALAASAPQTLYAAIASAGVNAGLNQMLTSADGGATWKQLSSAPNYLGTFGDYATALAVDPANPSIVYAGGASGPGSEVESTNGGNTWSDISSGANSTPGPFGGHHAFAFDANGKLLDATDGGLFRLNNPVPGSIAWTNLNGNQNTVGFTSVALDPTTPNIAYGGTPASGTVKFTDSLTWNQAQSGAGGFVRVSPANHLTVYQDAPVAVAGAANFVAVSTDGGNSWSPIANGINAANEPTAYYPPLALDPSNGSRLLLGTSRVYETVNSGGLWTPISTPGTNGWTAATAIDAIAAAGSDAHTVYAATQGHIFATFNDGTSWQQIDIPGFNDHIAALAVSPANNQIAFAVRDRFTGGPSGHVFETTTGGATWTDISGSLPDLPARALAFDPRTGLVFIGTDVGVYATNNAGTSWVALGAGLPDVRITALDWNAAQNILAAATAGRGVWEISLVHFNVTPSTTSTPAGIPVGLTVTALDPFNTVESAYTGTVHFTSTDPAGSLPSDYTFTAADAGVHAFSGVVLGTPGSQTVTGADTTNSSVAGSATVTVTPPVLSINNVSLPEGNVGTTPFTFTVTLSAASNQTVTVHYATADGTARVSLGDYQATSGTLTYSPGQTTQTITVLVNGNTLNESNETFFVNLSNSANAFLASSQGTGTINNDDPYPTLSVTNTSKTIGTSGTTKFAFNVSLSTASGQTVTVNYATADGTATAGSDYQATTGTLTFSPGQTSKPLTVFAFGTTAIEPFKTFFVNLSGASHAILLHKQGVGTILNNNLKVSIGSATATEPGAGYAWANFTVSLSGPASFPVNVNFATGGGTAVSRTDYVPLLDGLLTFTPGQTSQAINVPVLADPFDGVNRTFFVTLSDPTNAVLGGSFKGTGTIIDVPPAVTVSSVSQAEGNSGTTPFPFTISLASPAAQSITVQYATADGSGTAGVDYQATSGSVTFTAGVTSQTVTVPVIGNTSPQPDRTFFLNVTGPQNSAQGTGTILDDDSGPLVSINNVMLSPGTSGTKLFPFTVNLSGPSNQPVTVQYATADGTALAGTDYQAQSGTLSFSPGQTSQTINVAVNGNPTSGPDKVFAVNLTGVTNGRLTSTQGAGTILNEVLHVSIGNVTVTQPLTGVVSANFPVTLSDAAPFPVSVTYITAQSPQNTNAAPGQDFQAGGGTVTFAPGLTTQAISIPVFGEYYSEANETFSVKLTSAANATIGTALGTATLINTTPLTLAVTNVTQLEGTSGLTAFVFTLTLTGAPHEQTVAIQYATSDGTATAGTDYQAASGTVLLNPYNTKATITVWVNGDTNVDPDQTFFLNLTSQFGTAQGLGTIVNGNGPF
jgi:hypothetical protein